VSAPAIVRSHPELLERLAALPPPAPGHVRVFRGQTKDFGNLVPSGLRRAEPFAAIWNVYSRLVLTGWPEHRIVEKATVPEMQVLGLWLKALAQHYGPGSHFLDVTHDLGTALWFALHRAEGVSCKTVPRVAAEIDRPAEETCELEWFRYVPSGTPGMLFALDVPEWDGHSIPAHGELVDLANAPTAFSGSARIRAQCACLLAARSDVAGGDLRRHVVPDTPLVIDPGLAYPAKQRTTADLFPPPSVDHWYAKMLAAPLVYSHGDDGPSRLRQPIPVALYLDDPEGRYRADVARCIVTAAPALVHPHVERLMDARFPKAGGGTRPSFWWEEPRASDATIIQVEAPLLWTTPAAGSELWNHGLLATTLSEDAPVFDPDGVHLGRRSLTNVIVEFSPLEFARWDQADGPGFEAQLTRAVWIMNGGKDYEFAAFMVVQRLPGGDLFLPGPILFRYDERCRRLFFLEPGHPPTWRDPGHEEVVAKPVMTALMVIGAADGKLKPEATPHMSMSTGDGFTHFVRVLGRERLVEVRTERGERWCVLRCADGQLWTLESDRALAVLSVKGNCRWANVSPDAARAALLAKMKERDAPGA
jgi:hypothetical protein